MKGNLPLLYIRQRIQTNKCSYWKGDVTNGMWPLPCNGLVLFEQNRHSVDTNVGRSPLVLIKTFFSTNQTKNNNKRHKLCSDDDVKYLGISLLFYMLQRLATVFRPIQMNSCVYFVQRMTCVSFNTHNCLLFTMYAVRSIVL